ncbi:MAG: hypothetical protein M1818_002678 [Claussenomyces sp. TS43310]|nr:MAG: hypothetical protein M1818_002678 [Claussenomyces sp. TS43310]
MANNDGGAGPSVPSNATCYGSLNVPLESTNASDAPTSEDEWEYEYSQTETEDYYLTIDLTTPLTPSSRPSFPRTLRKSYRTKWVNPGLGQSKSQAGRRTKVALPNVGEATKIPADPIMTPAPDADEENEEAEADVDGDDDDDMMDPDAPADDAVTGDARDAGDTGDTGEERKLEDIQILDLHSENPFVSYRGVTFSCQWAENIGTELLFAEHDSSNSLTALRPLKDGVDLLAASSARLISNPVNLVPRYAPGQTGPASAGNDLPLRKEDDSAQIHTEAKISAERNEQALFLEKLMDLRIKRGEKDNVPLVAPKRPRSQQCHPLAAEQRQAERARLQSSLRKRSGHTAEQARKRLQEDDGDGDDNDGDGDGDGDNDDDEADEEQREPADDTEPLRAATRKRKVLDPTDDPRRPWRKSRLLAARISNGGAASLTAVQKDVPEWEVPQRALSTPTPRSWADLDLQDEFADAEEEEEEGEEEGEEKEKEEEGEEGEDMMVEG